MNVVGNSNKILSAVIIILLLTTSLQTLQIPSAHASSNLKHLMHYKKISNPEPGSGDMFGYSLATLGKDIIVGAVDDNFGSAANAGSVYLFDGNSHKLELTLRDPTPDARTDPNTGFDQFGFSLASFGNKIVVGERGDDVGADQSGSVHIFSDANGHLERTISDPSPTQNNNFGYSVATLDQKILIGKSHDDTGGFDAGSVFLYDGTTGTQLMHIANPNPTPSGIFGDNFGLSVAFLGKNILVGAPFDQLGGGGNYGAVYLFNGTNGNLLLTIPNPEPTNMDEFGTSLTSIGKNIVVSAPFDDFGATDSGSIYVFDSTNGNLLKTIRNPNPHSGDQFGTSLDNYNGNILVGAPNVGSSTIAGEAYLLDGNGNVLLNITNPQPHSGDEFGNSVAKVGEKIVVGAPTDDTGAADAGSIYVFG